MRRLIIHESIADGFVDRLASAYRSLPVGDPWEDGTLVGPLISEAAVSTMLSAVAEANSQGGEVLCGGGRLDL